MQRGDRNVAAFPLVARDAPPPPFDREYASQPNYGEMAAADSALGSVIDVVRHTRRPTLVIVAGDHGEGLGKHGEATHGLFAYEATLRVPPIFSEIDGERSRTSGHTGLALVAIRRGDHQSAIAHRTRAVEIQPSNYEALHDLGVQLARDGKRDAARRYLTQFVNTAPPAQYAKELQQVVAILHQLSSGPR